MRVCTCSGMDLTSLYKTLSFIFDQIHLDTCFSGRERLKETLNCCTKEFDITHLKRNQVVVARVMGNIRVMS